MLMARRDRPELTIIFISEGEVIFQRNNSLFFSDQIQFRSKEYNTEHRRQRHKDLIPDAWPAVGEPHPASADKGDSAADGCYQQQDKYPEPKTSSGKDVVLGIFDSLCGPDTDAKQEGKVHQNQKKGNPSVSCPGHSSPFVAEFVNENFVTEFVGCIDIRV